jgi:hypothetical protein
VGLFVGNKIGDVGVQFPPQAAIISDFNTTVPVRRLSIPNLNCMVLAFKETHCIPLRNIFVFLTK